MNPTTHCLECNAPLTTAETQGLCARCLLKMGFASQLAGGSSLPASPGNSGPPPMMPFSFGDYRIERLLGKGGMGAVYEAEDTASGRRVALKALGHSLDSPDTRKRFLREGRLAASINHPNTVYVYGTEEIEGAPVITMELIPGGTLQERVKEGGPMPVSAAVDAILQIIAGLEAAHAVGILHRDIKPSNCFIDPSGMVKVGDFGLSISTTSRGDSALTMAGSVLGTPEFSSPEQLRGEALDLRADIYSVGMTLYYLLTGQTAFRGENVVQLLATVLDKAAPSPRAVRPEIPEFLARIILRCLEKQSGDRPKNYDELRAALLPFTSTAPTPATLALRLVAGVVDQIILIGMRIIGAMLMFGGFEAMTRAAAMRSPGWFWLSLGLLFFEIAYFSVSEGRWGATPGKALVGLRVGGLDRNAPGIPRALLRALIYLVPTMVAFLRFDATGAPSESMVWDFVRGIALWLFPALLALTARRHNGFATVIDLLTKTRVIQKSDFESRESFAQIDEPVATTETMPQFGPFHALATLSSDDQGELVLGYDTKLMRRVWIRKVAADTAPVAAALRNAARPSRLRWLQGSREGADAWDAFESAPGTPLNTLLATPQPWKNVRHWLLDLSAEFAAATRDGSLPATLALDRVWITASGGAKLLDFRAPGAEVAVEPLAGTEGSAFLNQLAISALEGRVATAEEGRTSHPRRPVALRARGLLRVLREAGDFTALAGQLRALVQQRPAISRRRRLGLILGCTVPSLVIAALLLLGLNLSAKWQKKDPDVMRLKTALINHARMEKGEFVSPEIDPAAALPPLEIYIAGRYANVLATDVWSSPYVVSALSRSERKRAVEIYARHRDPSPEAMAAARTALGRAVDANGELDLAPHFKNFEKVNQVIRWPMAMGGFLWAAFLSVAAALFFRGGVLMRALGIAVVTRDGSDASRGRMLWRACLAWSWLPLGAAAVAMLVPANPVNFAVWLVANIVLGAVGWSAALPDRSLPDRLAGTWLVPR